MAGTRESSVRGIRELQTAADPDRGHIGVGLLHVVLEYYVKEWIPGELLDGAGDRIPTPFDALLCSGSGW